MKDAPTGASKSHVDQVTSSLDAIKEVVIAHNKFKDYTQVEVIFEKDIKSHDLKRNSNNLYEQLRPLRAIATEVNDGKVIVRTRKEDADTIGAAINEIKQSQSRGIAR